MKKDNDWLEILIAILGGSFIVFLTYLFIILLLFSPFIIIAWIIISIAK